MSTKHTPGCIIWPGYIDSHGYGRIQVGSKSKRAHRVEWERLHGPIPSGLQIDHLCRVRSCVNPNHLEPVTARVNILRGVGPTAINAHKTHCINGHPLSGNNLNMDTKGGRECKICRRKRWSAYRLRRVAAGTWDNNRRAALTKLGVNP